MKNNILSKFTFLNICGICTIIGLIYMVIKDFWNSDIEIWNFVSEKWYYFTPFFIIIIFFIMRYSNINKCTFENKKLITGRFLVGYIVYLIFWALFVFSVVNIFLQDWINIYLNIIIQFIIIIVIYDKNKIKIKESRITELEEKILEKENKISELKMKKKCNEEECPKHILINDLKNYKNGKGKK